MRYAHCKDDFHLRKRLSCYKIHFKLLNRLNWGGKLQENLQGMNIYATFASD